MGIEDTALHFGWVTKLGAKVRRWRRRFCVLTKAGILLYAKDPNSLHKPCGALDVRYIRFLRTGSEVCTP
jgi:hypothetical protein